MMEELVTFEEEEDMKKSSTQWIVIVVVEVVVEVVVVEVEGGRCEENKDRGLMAAAAEYLRHCVVGCTVGRRRSCPVVQ